MYKRQRHLRRVGGTRRSSFCTGLCCLLSRTTKATRSTKITWETRHQSSEHFERCVEGLAEAISITLQSAEDGACHAKCSYNVITVLCDRWPSQQTVCVFCRAAPTLGGGVQYMSGTSTTRKTTMNSLKVDWIRAVSRQYTEAIQISMRTKFETVHKPRLSVQIERKCRMETIALPYIDSTSR